LFLVFEEPLIRGFFIEEFSSEYPSKLVFDNDTIHID